MKKANPKTALILGCVLHCVNGVWAQDWPRQPERRIAFEMRDKPWVGEKGSVLEWLSEQTGLPVSISRAKPTGSLTFVNPHGDGAAKRYTLPEVINMLNDELFKQKLILLQRAKTFTIEPIDEKIDPAALPRVLPGELEQYGNTERVSVVFSLNALVAEDFAQEVKGLLGASGTVVPLIHANKLLVQDTVANLKRIQSIVKDSGQENQKTSNTCFSHPCQYIPARHAARVLHDLLGDPKAWIQAMQAPLSVREGADGPFGALQIPMPDLSKVRMHYISVDERHNTVLVTGSADKIAQAEAILKKIDAPQQKNQKPITAGPSVLKTYPVPDGNAGVLAKTLQEIYQSVPEVRIAAITNQSLMVWAGPTEQSEILAHLRSFEKPTTVFEVIPLTSLDASDAVDTLKGMLGSDAKRGAPYLKADTTRNAVVAKGTPGQISEIKRTLKVLAEGSTPPLASRMVVLTIEQGSTATLSVAEALERMLPQLLQNPVQIIAPAGNGTKGSEPLRP